MVGSIGRLAMLAVGMMCLGGPSHAQPERTTRVYAIAATYADMKSGGAGPAVLPKIMQKVSAFYAAGSRGTHRFIGEVHRSVIELPQPRPPGKCRLPDPAVLSAALNAAGLRLDGYHALVLVVPASAQGCRGGVQTTFVHREADGTSRRIPLAVSWSLTDRFIAHEIGHTHGLGHANALSCKGASLAPVCTVREYGNVWDLMGNGSFQMLSAPLRVRMGWTEPLVHTGGTQTYTIGAAARPGDLPTAIQVRLPRAENPAITVSQPMSLWVEYRAAVGFDQRMASHRFANFAAGAMVNLTGAWESKTGRRSSQVSCAPWAPCLLDMTPQSSGFGDAGLTVGGTWTEPFTGTRLTVDARTDSTLTVTVSVP